MASKPHSVKPQTAIFSKGYDPQRSEGAATPPVFRTSTFIFKTAAEGKRDSEILEEKIVGWDGAEAAAVFSSGMGAISSTCLAFLKPGDTLVFSDPVYGGTEYLFRHLLPAFGIRTKHFPGGATHEEMEALVKGDPTVKVIYLESPANPTMQMSDIGAAREIADKYSDDKRKILVMMDNTFMGPIFSTPIQQGVDVILYSATKFFGGHSDLIAGLAMGRKDLVGQIKVMRTILGSNSDPDTAWLIHRSLGTLQIRMEKQQENAVKIVEYLRKHPKIERVAYPGLAEMGERQVALWKKQCTGTGSIISLLVKGGEAEAFKVLDALEHMKLAVSLGGIETLIEHPGTMTHSDMTPAEKDHAGITENMIRVSVGLEDPEDLIADLAQALDKV